MNNNNNDTIGNEDNVFQDMFNPDLWVVNDLAGGLNNLTINGEGGDVEEGGGGVVEEGGDVEEGDVEEGDVEEGDVEEGDVEEGDVEEEDDIEEGEIVEPDDYVAAEGPPPGAVEQEGFESNNDTDVVHPIDASGNLIDDDSSTEEEVEEEESEINIEEIIVEDCCVCYKECTPLNIVNTPCGHIYCKECFFRWIRVRPTCPMCRRDFTSLNNMTHDQLNTEIASVTQLYRRTIIESNKLMKDNRNIMRENIRRKTKNIKLNYENEKIIERLIRGREQIDFTNGYNTAIKFKIQKDLTDHLNIHINNKNIHILRMNSLDYMNAPFYKGFKEGLIDNEYYLTNEKFNSADEKKILENQNVINKWKKASDDVLISRKMLKIHKKKHIHL